MEIKFTNGELEPEQNDIITSGFVRHTEENSAPRYSTERFNWLAYDDDELVAALTAKFLWDWLYIDELWVSESHRGTGLGKKLIHQSESYAQSENFVGIWLWTQSWQASDFYKHLGYQEFAEFPDFPRKHVRIGLRKIFSDSSR